MISPRLTYGVCVSNVCRDDQPGFVKDIFKN